MTDDLANAGVDTAAPDSSSISGEGKTADKPSEPRNAMKEAFEKAKTELDDDDKPKGDKQVAASDKREAAPDKAEKADKGEKAQKAEAKPADGKKPPEKQPESLKAPERWEPAWKDAFSKQPEDVQKAWLDQHKAWETGFNKKFEELAGARKFHDDVQSAIPTEARQFMEQRGIKPTQAIGHLFQRWQLSETNPAQFVAEFMRQKRIDPRAFLPQQGENGQQTAPAAQQLAPILQPLLQKIARLEQGQSAWQQQQQAEQDQAIEGAIASFQGEQDESGSSKFPYLERVAEHMADLIENDPRFAQMEPRQRLEEAYRIAVLSDPTIRDEIVSAEAQQRFAAMEQERLNGRLGSAASARPAASSSAPAPQPRGIRGSYDRAKKQLGAA